MDESGEFEETDSDGTIDVFEENWPAVAVFFGCSTQWRFQVPPMGGSLIYEGLIYPGVREVIWAHGYQGRRAREIFLDVQLMERAALAKLKE